MLPFTANEELVQVHVYLFLSAAHLSVEQFQPPGLLMKRPREEQKNETKNTQRLNRTQFIRDETSVSFLLRLFHFASTETNSFVAYIIETFALVRLSIHFVHHLAFCFHIVSRVHLTIDREREMVRNTSQPMFKVVKCEMQSRREDDIESLPFWFQWRNENEF